MGTDRASAISRKLRRYINQVTDQLKRVLIWFVFLMPAVGLVLGVLQ